MDNPTSESSYFMTVLRTEMNSILTHTKTLEEALTLCQQTNTRLEQENRDQRLEIIALKAAQALP